MLSAFLTSLLIGVVQTDEDLDEVLVQRMKSQDQDDVAMSATGP